jgi:hypothetical protein
VPPLALLESLQATSGQAETSPSFSSVKVPLRGVSRISKVAPVASFVKLPTLTT